MNIKIAAISDDGQTLSQHFGRAQFYTVLTIVDGKVTTREQREKIGHTHFAGEEHAEDKADPRGHGFDPAAQTRHASMVANIADCQVLLARGMGAGAYQSVYEAGIKPVVTDVVKIDEAVQQYLLGALEDHIERLH